MTIAVTGATGHLGKLVIESLLARTASDNIVAIVRDSAKAEPLAERGVEVRVAEYGNRASLDAAVVGVDTLLLISSSEIGQRFEQHKNVIDAAVSAGVGRVVYTSAPKATTSTLVLAPDHKATEEYLTASGVTYTVLRNSWYTENYFQQVETSKATGTLVAAAGDGRVASAPRADYAEAAAVVLTTDGHDNTVYELSGDYAWDFNELAAAISEVAGREVVYQPVDADTLVAGLLSAGLDEGTAGFVAALDTNIAEGALSETSGALAKLLGRPTVPLRETLGSASAQG